MLCGGVFDWYHNESVEAFRGRELQGPCTVQRFDEANARRFSLDVYARQGDQNSISVISSHVDSHHMFVNSMASASSVSSMTDFPTDVR